MSSSAGVSHHSAARPIARCRRRGVPARWRAVSAGGPGAATRTRSGAETIVAVRSATGFGHLLQPVQHLLGVAVRRDGLAQVLLYGDLHLVPGGVVGRGEVNVRQGVEIDL